MSTAHVRRLHVSGIGKGRLIRVLGGIVLIAVLLASTAGAVAAGNPSGFGNGDFHGVSSTVPGGYLEPPDAYDQGDTVEYSFTVTNTTGEPVALQLVWNVTHILRLGDLDISGGWPSLAGTTFKENWQQAVPQVLVHSEPGLISLQPGESRDYLLTWQATECGYFQIDLGRDIPGGFETLNSGYIRVLNCQGGEAEVVAAEPPSPAPGVGAPPDEEVLSLLPVTGSLDGFTRMLVVGALIAGALVMFGAYLRVRTAR